LELANEVAVDRLALQEVLARELANSAQANLFDGGFLSDGASTPPNLDSVSPIFIPAGSDDNGPADVACSGERGSGGGSG
jgi:hypothetical protein